MRDKLSRHTNFAVRDLRSSGLNRQIEYSLSQFLQMHMRLTACGMHRYFSSSAASGGSITTYGYWQDSKRTCFGKAQCAADSSSCMYTAFTGVMAAIACTLLLAAIRLWVQRLLSVMCRPACIACSLLGCGALSIQACVQGLMAFEGEQCLCRLAETYMSLVKAYPARQS